MTKERVTISQLGHHGDGLANTAQGIVSVPFTLPDETVIAEITQQKEHLNGKLIEILTQSPARAQPPCAVFGQCGGCRMQHIDTRSYGEWKLGVVNHQLEKNGFAARAETIFITPPATRRRVTFTAIKQPSGLQFGFHKRESHDVVSIDDCSVIRPELASLIKPLRELLETTLQLNDTLSIHATILNGVIELVFSGKLFADDQTHHLISWAATHGISRLFTKRDENAQPQLLLSQTALTAHYGAHSITLPPAAFMQASDEAEAAMLHCIKPFFKSSKHMADLFCGTGLFALSLYDKSKTMLTVDVDGEAINALHSTTQTLRGFKTARRNLFREPLKAIELKSVDSVCLDPPRAGAKEQVMELARSKISRIAYVSCNPITFMRDAKILTDGGFKLTQIHVFDQFLWSHHIELIGLFTR